MFSLMFPPRFKQTFHFLFCMPFNPLNCFVISFWGNSNLVCLHFRLLVRDFSLADTRSNGLNENVLILSDLELPALTYIAPITAISGCQNIDYNMRIKSFGGLVGRWFVTLKSIQGTTELCGENPFDFMQSFYTAI